VDSCLTVTCLSDFYLLGAIVTLLKLIDMEKALSKKTLLNRLKTATVTCFDCGKKYGVYHNGVSSVWPGECHVCRQSTSVTETRDFAYFITGIRNLEIENKE